MVVGLWRGMLVAGALTLLVGACGSSRQGSGAPSLDAGGGTGGSPGAGSGGAGGSAASGGTAGSSGGPSQAQLSDCSQSGACVLVGCFSGAAAVSVDELSAYLAAGCPSLGADCCAVRQSGFPDTSDYAVCMGGSLCAEDNDPPPPPAGGVCPATAPTAGQACNAPMRCEYDDDPRPLCRATFDCSGADAKWQSLAPSCSALVTCPAGQVAGTSCTQTDSTCTALDGSVCVCGKAQGATTNAWQCAPASTTQGCPPQPPRLGQPCSSSGLCCEYGDQTLQAGDPGRILLTARTCQGTPSVWVANASYSCL